MLVLLAMSLTPGLDAISKELGQTHDPFFVVFARYAAAGLIALIIAGITGEEIALDVKSLPGQLLRAGLMMGAMCAFVTALTMVPLADAVGGFLIAPIVATGLSVVLLGERMSRQKIIGALLSLLGAVLILRPGLNSQAGTLFALGGGVLLGCYFTASRGTGRREGVVSALAVQSLLGSAMVAPMALSNGVPMIDIEVFGWILALGIVSALTHVMMIMAFRLAEASVLAPFMYFNLVVAVALGIVLFGEVPEAMTLAGLGAILFGGLTTAVRPQVLTRLLGALPGRLAAPVQPAPIGVAA